MRAAASVAFRFLQCREIGEGFFFGQIVGAQDNLSILSKRHLA